MIDRQQQVANIGAQTGALCCKNIRTFATYCLWLRFLLWIFPHSLPPERLATPLRMSSHRSCSNCDWTYSGKDTSSRPVVAHLRRCPGRKGQADMQTLAKRGISDTDIDDSEGGSSRKMPRIPEVGNPRRFQIFITEVNSPQTRPTLHQKRWMMRSPDLPCLPHLLSRNHCRGIQHASEDSPPRGETSRRHPTLLSQQFPRSMKRCLTSELNHPLFRNPLH